MTTNNSANLGRRIKAIRESLGLTGKAFAEKLGVSGATVTQWEKGKNMPTMEKILDISNFSGIPAHKLLELNYLDPKDYELEPFDPVEIGNKAEYNLSDNVEYTKFEREVRNFLLHASSESRDNFLVIVANYLTMDDQIKMIKILASLLPGEI